MPVATEWFMLVDWMEDWDLGSWAHLIGTRVRISDDFDSDDCWIWEAHDPDQIGKEGVVVATRKPLYIDPEGHTEISKEQAGGLHSVGVRIDGSDETTFYAPPELLVKEVR